ncbi:hypothetical protein LTR36_010862 [Oleoguttula mirabilis]|uniref:Uncharacterized protein n=1 Tax=Oleoguttula mirabilis TaxID=1507867 RepID=A0AAV9J3N2_9PEZI|nr:hypothetical protein LTR36_010862 [Oleoguttula mirabilis]
MSGNAGFNILRDTLWGGGNNWLHNRSEDETYKLLIDSYHLRIEDEYTFRGDAGGLYADEDPVPHFRRFLRKAEKKEGVLPPWWTLEKKTACVRKGNTSNEWSCLHAAVEKSDIQEHYHDNTMPTQLRMLADEITGSNVMSPA